MRTTTALLLLEYPRNGVTEKGLPSNTPKAEGGKGNPCKYFRTRVKCSRTQSIEIEACLGCCSSENGFSEPGVVGSEMEERMESPFILGFHFEHL